MFHTDDKGPFCYDYLFKGFLCETARTLKSVGSVLQLQDKFKRYCFVSPRRVYLGPLAEKPLERPLRAMTAKGPRVTLVRSDVIPAGRQIDFQIRVLRGANVTQHIIECVLGYGELQGVGQWRTGGHGRFGVLSIKKTKAIKADIPEDDEDEVPKPAKKTKKAKDKDEAPAAPEVC